MRSFLRLQKDRMIRAILFLYSLVIRTFTTVKTNRIVFWSFSYTQYGCNPKYISDYLLEKANHKYEVYWIFLNDIDTSTIDPRIHIVRYRSFRYFIIMNTAKILITNCRTSRFESFWLKRKSQKYIMTWHSSMGIKKIEKDAEDSLSKAAIKICKYDSSICDLILSGGKYRTEVIKRAFWYSGEILEKGTPRNDLFFQDCSHLKSEIFKKYNIPQKNGIILYAPTFRSGYGLESYDIDWERVLPEIESKFNRKYSVMLRLHPIFRKLKNTKKMMTSANIVDVTDYLDMQELLAVSDILITDYSSSMFDFAIPKKTCFLYVNDFKSYDRGAYFQLSDLPFPVAYSNDMLIDKIRSYDESSYQKALKEFDKEVIQSFENGNAAASVFNWLEKVINK